MVAYVRDDAASAEWSALQHEVVRCYCDTQRAFIATQDRSLACIHDGVEPLARDPADARELLVVLGELSDIAHEIGRVMAPPATSRAAGRSSGR